MAETNTNNLIPLGNWRDVGGGLTLAAVAGLFPTLFIFLGNWGKFHCSWKSAMGLAFIFGVPGLGAASGLGHAWWRESWYITPDGAVVVWRRRRWSGTLTTCNRAYRPLGPRPQRWPETGQLRCRTGSMDFTNPAFASGSLHLAV